MLYIDFDIHHGMILKLGCFYLAMHIIIDQSEVNPQLNITAFSVNVIFLSINVRDRPYIENWMYKPGIPSLMLTLIYLALKC